MCSLAEIPTVLRADLYAVAALAGAAVVVIGDLLHLPSTAVTIVGARSASGFGSWLFGAAGISRSRVPNAIRVPRVALRSEMYRSLLQRSRRDLGADGTRTVAEHLYCRHVRTVHAELHLGANPRALPPDRAGRDSQFSAELQRLPDRSGGQIVRSAACASWSLCDGRLSVLVEQVAQGSMKLASFNARVETVTTKPFFREPFKSKRCLMPVSGYYEWQDMPGGKQPWYFTARDGSPVLTVAALWDEWKNRETGERIKSCAMIISRAERLCRRGARPYAGPVAA